MSLSLAALVHANPKVGKSTLGLTSPAPRLVLDAENGVKFFLKAEDVVYWNPHRDAPPAPGEWTTCVVLVRDFSTMTKAYEWLNQAEHPFRSIVLDSLTRIQKRCKDALIGTDDVVTERQWGQLLVRMERLVGDYCDLLMHPTHPVECVFITALSDEKKGMIRPAIQGGLSTSLPGLVDLIGYYAVIEDADADGNATRVRRLLVSAHPQYEAGDRTGFFEKLGTIDNPNLQTMIGQLSESLEA